MSQLTNEMPAILMTGSTGLIGTRLTSTLAPRYRVMGLDVQKPESLPENAGWMECDLTNDRSVEQALASVRERLGPRLASVIHLAAYYDFSGEPSPLYEQLTVEGSRRLVRGLRDFEVEQFIFSSSLLVMKPVEEEGSPPLTESSPTRAEWDYPRSKLEAEAVLKQEHGAMPLAILRIAGVYDDNGRCLPVVHQIQRIREMRLESLLFPGDADHGQPFIHLEDLVNAFSKVIEYRKVLPPETTFLIAEPDVMSYRKLQQAIGELIHGKKWPTVRIPAPVAKAGAWTREKLTAQEAFIRPWMIDLADDHYPVEIKRANKQLNWQPEHRLRDTLPEIIRRLERDPKGWYEINGLEWPEESAQPGQAAEPAGARKR